MCLIVFGRSLTFPYPFGKKVQEWCGKKSLFVFFFEKLRRECVGLTFFLGLVTFTPLFFYYSAVVCKRV